MVHSVPCVIAGSLLFFRALSESMLVAESTSLSSSSLVANALNLLAQGLPPVAQAMPAENATTIPLSPIVILILCVVAGVGTVLLLPGRREATIRAIGGIVLLAAGLIFAAVLVRWTAGHPRGGM